MIRKPLTAIDRPPLFLIIHGYGADEKDLFSFAKDLPACFFVISLQAPHPLPFGGFAWYAIEFSEKGPSANITQAVEAREKITSFIDEATEHYHLSKNDVWLFGFSQGSILSYAIALYHPEKVKKVIALSGFPHKDLLPGEVKTIATSLDFFVSHGRKDTIIPIELARKGPALLDRNKIPFFYKEYDAGHRLNASNYEDMMQWIKARRG
ncbi:MAG: alpha/beta hydrolase [Flavobacteriales bacterium Tduv]